MQIDFSRINQSALHSIESLLVEWFPNGKKVGREFVIGDIYGSAGSSLKINLNSGKWADFASDLKGGDLISLLAAIDQSSNADAARKLEERLGLGNLNAQAPLGRIKQKYNIDEDLIAQPYAPDGCAEPDVSHYKYGVPTHTWTYYTEDGKRAGLICRYTKEDNSKEILPMSWCKSINGKEGWKWKAFAKPRPLYRLPDIINRPDAWVLIVEGEKAADAAQRLMPHMVVTTWAGGSKALNHTNWEVLKDRKVIIWPDNDKAGIDAATELTKLLPHCRYVNLPTDKPEGWDLADAEAEGWTTDMVRECIKKKPEVPKIEIREAYEPTDNITPPDEYIPEDVPDVVLDHNPPDATPWPFRILGHDDGIYYYLPDASQQIVALTASEHKQLQFLRLASSNWWEEIFPGNKQKTDWSAAANALIQRSHAAGIFSPRKIRGRGCWIDGEHVIYHAGDRLIVSGVEHRIPSWDSKWIYEQGQRMEVEQVLPCSNEDASKLIKLSALLNWKEPIYHRLFAGWCVVAPICGVLNWRPHIWINGPSGSGKTWLLNNILDPLVGKCSLSVQSATTEAGIRQSLRSDSLAVVFDEAESEDKRGQTRMQSILELARQASAETGAGIIKGTASGRAQEFQVRSCFAFASIGIAAIQRADTSRITGLELVKDNSEEGQRRFEELKALWANTIAQPNYVESIRSRALTNAKVIKANAKTFGKAVAVKLSDQRIGDQIGALVAGAFSLTSLKELSLEDAKAWVDKQDWSGFMPEESDQDEVRALSWLMDKQIRFEDGERNYQRGIGELIQAYYSPSVTVEAADNYQINLLRVGIKLESDTVCIANSHPALRQIFADTSWTDKWKDQFSRVKGATHLAACRFGASIHRAVRIPNRAFIS